MFVCLSVCLWRVACVLAFLCVRLFLTIVYWLCDSLSLSLYRLFSVFVCLWLSSVFSFCLSLSIYIYLSLSLSLSFLSLCLPLSLSLSLFPWLSYLCFSLFAFTFLSPFSLALGLGLICCFVLVCSNSMLVHETCENVVQTKKRSPKHPSSNSFLLEGASKNLWSILVSLSLSPSPPLLSLSLCLCHSVSF